MLYLFYPHYIIYPSIQLSERNTPMPQNPLIRCQVINLLTYLYLLLMGCVASQLYTPISLQCRSSLFLKVLTDVASITVCGSLFHSFTMRTLKKCCLTVVRHLGLNSFMECPRKPVVTSASWKNVLGSLRSFPVKILNSQQKHVEHG